MHKTYLEAVIQQCHTAIFEKHSGTIHIFDTMCKRSLNLVQKRLNSENVLVNFVCRHAIFIAECFLVWVEMCSFTANVSVAYKFT